MRKSVGQAPTVGKQTRQKPCQTSSNIGAEEENYTVVRGPTHDRKGLKVGRRISFHTTQKQLTSLYQASTLNFNTVYLNNILNHT
jgi:hypothetical protein